MGYSLAPVCMGWTMAQMGKMACSGSYSPVIAGNQPYDRLAAAVGHKIRYELGLQETSYIREARVTGHKRRGESSFAVVMQVRTLNATDPDMLPQLTPSLFLHPEGEVVFSLDGRSFPVLAGKQGCTQVVDNSSNFRDWMSLAILPCSPVHSVGVLRMR